MTVDTSLPHLKLGKLPAQPLPPEAKKFSLAALMPKPEWPKVPVGFGEHKRVRDWGMLANDKFGNCVWAGAAHEHMMLTMTGDVPDATFTDDNVNSDYAAVTGFRADDPDSDQGTDMRQAADYRRKTGIVDANGVRHKVVAHLALRPGDVEQLALALYLFDAVGVGVKWPASATKQFDDHLPFEVVKGSKLEGGHYMSGVGRNSKGHFLLVTWGRLQAMTPQWYSKFCDEALVYLTEENLSGGKTPDGFDLPKLKQYLRALR